MNRAVALAVLLAALLAAGCAAKVSALRGEVVALGDSPRVSDSWAYDGKGVRNAEGSVEVRVNDVTNQGSLVAFADDGRDQYRVDWSTFAPLKPFHDGGIARDFDEHGATGVGDAMIPKVHLLAAGWGEAKLTLNGVAVPDPGTGNATLKAHFMVIDGALRGADNVIWNLSREKPYDPATPADGALNATGREVVVTLSSHESAPPLRFFLALEYRATRVDA